MPTIFTCNEKCLQENGFYFRKITDFFSNQYSEKPKISQRPSAFRCAIKSKGKKQVNRQGV